MPLVPTILCNNILQRAFQEDVPVTPMKLQKLLYFAACEYIKATGSPLMAEDFCVWKYGPVLPSVYQEFHSFHKDRITKYAQDANGNSYAYEEGKSPNVRNAINRVWDSFKNHTGVALSQITHEDGSGWSCAFARGASQISTEEMKADVSYTKYLCY